MLINGLVEVEVSKTGNKTTIALEDILQLGQYGDRSLIVLRGQSQGFYVNDSYEDLQKKWMESRGKYPIGGRI